MTSLTFHTFDSLRKSKVYGPYGKNKERGFSLLINNDQQASAFYESTCGRLESLGIQQTPHQITQEDWDLIVQIEVLPK